MRCVRIAAILICIMLLCCSCSVGSIGSIDSTDGSNNDRTDNARATTEKPETSTVLRPTLITRTKNNSGKPSDSFVGSLSGFTLSVCLPYAKNPHWSEYCRSVQKQYDVTININTVYESYSAALTAALASRTAKHHIYYSLTADFGSYIKNGYAADLTDGCKRSGVDLRDDWYYSDATEMLNINYKQLGWVAKAQRLELPAVILYNSAITDSCGLGSIKTEVADGEWTLDRLEKYALSANRLGKIGFGCMDASGLLESIMNAKNCSVFRLTKGEYPTCVYDGFSEKSALGLFSDWYNKTGVCSDLSADNSALEKLSDGDIAMLYAPADVVSRIIGHGCNAKLGIAPFPNEWQSKRYIGLSTPEYICFVPAQYKGIADRILFVQNELYRAAYAYCRRDLAQELEQLNVDSSGLATLFNLKFERAGNSVRLSLTDMLEYSLAVGVNSVAGYITGGGSAEQAVNRYAKSAKQSAEDCWQDYKITGRVDRIFALE